MILRVNAAGASGVLVIGTIVASLVMLNHIKVQRSYGNWSELLVLVLILRPLTVYDVLAYSETGRGRVCSTRCYVRIRGNG